MSRIEKKDILNSIDNELKHYRERVSWFMHYSLLLTLVVTSSFLTIDALKNIVLLAYIAFGFLLLLGLFTMHLINLYKNRIRKLRDTRNLLTKDLLINFKICTSKEGWYEYDKISEQFYFPETEQCFLNSPNQFLSWVIPLINIFAAFIIIIVNVNVDLIDIFSFIICLLKISC